MADSKMTTRGKMSRIDGLPEDIRDEINRLLRARVPQADIIKRLQQPLADKGEPPLSRSGLNRHANKMEKWEARINATRGLADRWMSKFGERPTGQTGEVIIEMLRIMAFELTQKFGDNIDAEDEDMAATTELISNLALSVQRLERASEMSSKREKEWRKAFAQEAETAAKKSGISPDKASALRAMLTGGDVS